MKNRFDLTGKVALITGGAGLLGVEHGTALAECGARVVLGDLNEDAATKAAQKIGSGARGVKLDVTSLESIRKVQQAIGDLDILVNNAAVDPKVSKDAGMVESSRLENFSLEQWNFQLGVGLTGAFLCAQVFGPKMAERGSGVILNIASDLSVIAPDQRLYRKKDLPENRQPVKPVTYSVIKTGLIGLTRYLSGYWAGQGVRVNALSPGGVFVDHPDEFVARLSALIPMGRMANRDEYRAAVQFLCSDASSYMTGQNVVMDGGRSVL